MKLRIKIHKKRFNISLTVVEDCDLTIGHLQQELTDTYHLSDFNISLNGVDIITEGEEVKLQDVGIVSGDLVTVLADACQLSRFEDVLDEPTPVKGPESPSNGGQASQVASSSLKSERLVVPDECQPSTSAAAISNNEEQNQKKAQEILDRISNDPEAICDNQVNKYLNEPLLIRDSVPGSIPQVLLRLQDGCGITSAEDNVFMVLHALMLETAYHLTDHNTVKDSCNEGLPDDWKKEGRSSLEYLHPSCPDVRFTLALVSLGPIAVVHGVGSYGEFQEICHMSVKPSDYYQQTSSAVDAFKNLPRLSRLFKDTISHNLLQKLRDVLQLPNVGGIQSLVTEAKLLVFGQLDVRSLLNMAQTCQEFHTSCNEKSLWRRLYLKDFGRRQNNDLNQNWRLHYKDKYLLRKRLREDMRTMRMVVPPDFGRRPFPFNPDPFAVGPGAFGPAYPPGYVGGDYDRDPLFGGFRDPLGIERGRRPLLGRPRPRFDPMFPGQGPFRPGSGGGLFGSGQRFF